MELAKVPWTRVAQWFSATPRPIVLLPLGSIEAHGPHLPLDTDTQIAVLLTQRSAERLKRETQQTVLVAPSVTTTAASYAAAFAGTISAERETEKKVLHQTIRSFFQLGAKCVVLINLHFDPEHMRAVRETFKELERGSSILFPDFTRRPHAQKIGGEFATGACHGGEFETSLMLVAAPSLVDPLHRKLPAREVDLARAIREGKRSFQELGLHEAYCGHPASATSQEGERLLEVLTRIVSEEVQSIDGGAKISKRSQERKHPKP